MNFGIARCFRRPLISRPRAGLYFRPQRPRRARLFDPSFPPPPELLLNRSCPRKPRSAPDSTMSLKSSATSSSSTSRRRACRRTRQSGTSRCVAGLCGPAATAHTPCTEPELQRPGREAQPRAVRRGQRRDPQGPRADRGRVLQGGRAGLVRRARECRAAPSPPLLLTAPPAASVLPRVRRRHGLEHHAPRPAVLVPQRGRRPRRHQRRVHPRGGDLLAAQEALPRGPVVHQPRRALPRGVFRSTISVHCSRALQTSFQTEMGQLLDLITAPEDKVDLSKFSLERCVERPSGVLPR